MTTFAFFSSVPCPYHHVGYAACAAREVYDGGQEYGGEGEEGEGPASGLAPAGRQGQREGGQGINQRLQGQAVQAPAQASLRYSTQHWTYAVQYTTFTV